MVFFKKLVVGKGAHVLVLNSKPVVLIQNLITFSDGQSVISLVSSTVSKGQDRSKLQRVVLREDGRR